MSCRSEDRQKAPVCFRHLNAPPDDGVFQTASAPAPPRTRTHPTPAVIPAGLCFFLQRSLTAGRLLLTEEKFPKTTASLRNVIFSLRPCVPYF